MTLPCLKCLITAASRSFRFNLVSLINSPLLFSLVFFFQVFFWWGRRRRRRRVAQKSTKEEKSKNKEICIKKYNLSTKETQLLFDVLSDPETRKKKKKNNRKKYEITVMKSNE